jgi:dTDP-4-dehydrorhamnose reductase
MRSGLAEERARQAARPDIIINPAAYTAVDRGPEALLARAINTIAPAVLAEEARRLGIPLLHFSTDYAFTWPGGGAVHGRTSDFADQRLQHQAGRRAGGPGLGLHTSDPAHELGVLAPWPELPAHDRASRAERTRLTIVATSVARRTGRGNSRAAAALAGKSCEELAEHGESTICRAGETTWHGFAETIVASMRLPNPWRSCRSRRATIQRRHCARPHSVLCTAKLQRVFGIVLPQWEDAFAECQRTHAPTDLAAARPSG